MMCKTLVNICPNGNDNLQAELQSCHLSSQAVNHAPPKCKGKFKSWSGDFRSKVKRCSVLIH
jgi:hypothetical protein